MKRAQFIKTLVVAFASVIFLGGCDVVKMANEALYPFDQTNKSNPMPATPPAGWTSVTFSFNAADGTAATAEEWYSTAAGPGAPVIVYFHGNGENLESMYKYNFLTVAQELNANIVTFDYPSYGHSKGETTENTLVTAGVKAIQWTKANFPGQKIFVWGRSLGASAALLAAAKTQSGLSGLILTSGWTDFYSVAVEKSSLAKQLPADWKTKNAYNSKAMAPSIRLPVLQFHGTKDTTVPYHFGEELSHHFTSAPSAQFVPVVGRQHNDMYQEKSLWQAVHNFIHKP